MKHCLLLIFWLEIGPVPKETMNKTDIHQLYDQLQLENKWQIAYQNSIDESSVKISTIRAVPLFTSCALLLQQFITNKRNGTNEQHVLIAGVNETQEPIYAVPLRSKLQPPHVPTRSVATRHYQGAVLLQINSFNDFLVNYHSNLYEQ